MQIKANRAANGAAAIIAVKTDSDGGITLSIAWETRGAPRGLSLIVDSDQASKLSSSIGGLCDGCDSPDPILADAITKAAGPIAVQAPIVSVGDPSPPPSTQNDDNDPEMAPF